MLSATPNGQVLDWAAGVVGLGARVVAVTSLHGGNPPWLLQIEHQDSTRDLVLRVATPGRHLPFQITTGAAALRAAEQHDLQAPRLIAADLDGRVAGAPATLETVVPGSSASPPRVSAQRLRTAGAAIAKVHKVPLEPQRDLPVRVRSTQGPWPLDTRALERRWAALYRASLDSAKHTVVEALCELTGWSSGYASNVMSTTPLKPLLQLGDDTLRAIPQPHAATVLLHADLWAGNMMWTSDTDVTLIDWKDSGVGSPGVDLGHLRMQMALQYGQDAASHVLDGWQRETSREAEDVPYWDLVAALHTPTELNDWEDGFNNEGKRLSGTALTDRRDTFLRNALDQLDPSLGELKYLDPNSV